MEDKYVVSDEKGNYIAYARTCLKAGSIAAAGNRELKEQGADGSYAVGIKTQTGEYSFDW